MALDLLRPRQFGVGRGHNREAGQGVGDGLVAQPIRASDSRPITTGSYGAVRCSICTKKDGEEGEEGCGSCFIVGGLIT